MSSWKGPKVTPEVFWKELAGQTLYVVIEREDEYGHYNVAYVTLDEDKAYGRQVERIRQFLVDKGREPAEVADDDDMFNLYDEEDWYYCEVATWEVENE